MKMKKSVDIIIAEMFDNYDINADDDAKDDFWHELTDEEQYMVNSRVQLENGNPKYDYLSCSEPGRFDNNEVVTDYETLYEVDYKWWEFQKKCRWDGIEEMKGHMNANDTEYYSPQKVSEVINAFNDDYDGGYTIYLTGDWYRLIENGKLLYSQFISARWYLYYELENLLDTLGDENIPYSYKDSDDKLMFINEPDAAKKYDAQGREYELESFNCEIMKYQHDEMIDKIDVVVDKYKCKFSGKVFRTQRDETIVNDCDDFVDFIFYDEQSLKNVSPKNFLKTFKQNQEEFSEFALLFSELVKIVTDDFYRIYDANKLKYSDTISYS
jgi:hypothetical protein